MFLNIERIVVYFLLLASAFKHIYCGCKATFVTKCDRFSDLRHKITNSEKWVELQIGHETPSEEKESANLMRFDFSGLTELTSMKIIKRVNNLETAPWGCDYNLKLQTLIFYGNTLATIKASSIPNFKLRVLKMTNNEIESIENDALASHKIEVLDLSDNALKKIESDSLPRTNITRVIYLNNNKISSIDANSFGAGLELLDLSDNKLQSLSDDVLHDLAQLRALILGNNEFTTIPPIESLTNIKVFDFSHNQIENIHENQFDIFKALEVLDLSFNKLSEAPFLFKLLKKQKKITVSLQFNLIMVLKSNGDSLSLEHDSNKKLLLFGNPWQCTNWSLIEAYVKPFLEKCDNEKFSYGHPQCINLTQHDLGHGYVEALSKFQNDIRNYGIDRGCDISYEKVTVLYPSPQNCEL